MSHKDLGFRTSNSLLLSLPFAHYFQGKRLKANKIITPKIKRKDNIIITNKTVTKYTRNKTTAIFSMICQADNIFKFITSGGNTENK